MGGVFSLRVLTKFCPVTIRSPKLTPLTVSLTPNMTLWISLQHMILLEGEGELLCFGYGKSLCMKQIMILVSRIQVLNLINSGLRI